MLLKYPLCTFYSNIEYLRAEIISLKNLAKNTKISYFKTNSRTKVINFGIGIGLAYYSDFLS